MSELVAASQWLHWLEDLLVDLAVRHYHPYADLMPLMAERNTSGDCQFTLRKSFTLMKRVNLLPMYQS